MRVEFWRIQEGQGSCPVDHQKCQESLLAETLCQFRRLHRPRHSLENHQRAERQLLRSTNPPDRLRLWVSSRKHTKGRNASQILCISQQQRKSIPALCTHQVSASAEPRISFLPDDSHLSDPISISEVHDALRRCGNSSPGPDGMHYEMLRRLPLLSLDGILALFNQSWSSGVVPHSWRRAIVAPILKKGKLPSLPSSYRPISLTFTLCKLQERVIATRLRWFLESKNMLNQYQADFRKGRGCVDHIVRLT